MQIIFIFILMFPVISYAELTEFQKGVRLELEASGYQFPDTTYREAQINERVIILKGMMAEGKELPPPATQIEREALCRVSDVPCQGIIVD